MKVSLLKHSCILPGYYFKRAFCVGIMCELLWSDPQPQRGRAPSKRGVGIQFGPDVTETFIKKNKLDYIVRSHEVKPEGYEVLHGKPTVFFNFRYSRKY